MKVKNKSNLEDSAQEENKSTKKPFNKKEWRRKKYSNKYKVEQWEQRRRKAALHHYHKELRKGAAGKESPLINKRENNSVPKPAKLSAYKEAQKEFERKQAEKKAKWDTAQTKKKEMSEALAKYRKNKMERYKKLSKKTKKGQPVMKDRIELLLQKLQQNQ